MTPPQRRSDLAGPPRVDTVGAFKRQIAAAIVHALDGWTQVNAAALLRLDQPRVSNLRNGRLERFSLDQLARLLERVDASVELTITAHPRRRRWLFQPPD
jgi:predicted XRE-type DNA-binding protein